MKLAQILGKLKLRNINSKKAQMTEAYELGEKMGYYIIAIIIMSALFFFLAILAIGITEKYYKNNYGVNAMNVEERLFNCISYVDPVTRVKYNKIIEFQYFNDQASNTLDQCMGVKDTSDYRGVKAVIFDLAMDNRGQIATKNYIDRPDFTKSYPILIYMNNKYEVGVINISYWKV